METRLHCKWRQFVWFDYLLDVHTLGSGDADRLIHRIRIWLNGSKMNESISYQNQVYFCLNATNRECIGIWAFHIWNIKKINRKIKSFRSNKINDTTYVAYSDVLIRWSYKICEIFKYKIMKIISKLLIHINNRINRLCTIWDN